MPKEDEQNKERSKITLRIGEVQVELEGTSDNIKKLMDKELVYFAKGLEETAKQVPPSTETAPKTLEAAAKEKTMPPTPSSTPSTLQATPAKKPGFFSRGKKTEKTDKKRNRWKILTAALIMVCIVVSAGLVGAIAIYSPMVNNLDTQVAEKDADIAALNSQIAALNSQIAALHDQIAALQTEFVQNASYIDSLEESLDILNSRIQFYLNIVYMNSSEYLPVDDVSQNASTYTVLFEGTLKYNGYVAVSANSTSNTTYIQLLYSSYGVNYDHNVTVATNGTAYFPVLIGEVEIRLGNTDTYAGDFINATVSALYTF